MPAPVRRFLLRHALALLVLLDLALWLSFVLHQWLGFALWPAWGLGGLLSLALTVQSMPLIDRLLEASANHENDHFLGGTIP